MRSCLACCFVLVLAAGCGNSTNPVSDGGNADAPSNLADAAVADGPVIDAPSAADARVADAPPWQPDAQVNDAFLPANGVVDVLFVVDNSGSMGEEQTTLANAFASFISTIETVFGGRPSLHIGVVSTDLGAGPWNISGCTGNGDNGAFHSTPTNGSCSGPTDPWIKDVINPDGSRSTNYSGSLADTFSCIATLGINGCGFEQPLESMRRALNNSNPGNVGFLRPEAVLAVIIVSDEDDCSTENTAMFDTSQNDLSSPLGPLSSFRCFEFGVVCDPDEPRTPGAKSSCVPRDTSPYMYQVTPYISFLKGLKADPNRVVVGVIAAPPSPVAVETTDMGYPRLGASCVSAIGEAAPAVRLTTFANGFGANASVSTICSTDYNPAMADIAMKVVNLLP